MSALSMFPQNYGYVLGMLGLTTVTNIYLSAQVGMARKKYGIDYPNLYAPTGHKHEKAFNQVQRGHQNTLENMGLFLVQMMFVGLVYPLTAAFFGACFCVGSIVYMEGYKSSPDKRIAGGVIKHIGDILIFFPLMKMAYDMVMA